MSSYRIGFCPLCSTQIMVKDPNGRWNSFKPNYRQVDLVFEDGHRMRSPLCDECFGKEPDFEKLMGSITCKKSEAGSENKKEKLKLRGLPVSWSLANSRQGVSLRK